MGNKPIEPTVVSGSTSLVSIASGVKELGSNYSKDVTMVLSKVHSMAIDVKQNLSSLVPIAKSIASDAITMEIKGEDDLVSANQFIVDLTPCIKSATAHKDSFTQEIKRKCRDIDNSFNDIVKTLEGASDLVRSKIVKYRRDQQELEREVASILNQGSDGTTPPEVTPPSITEQKSIRVDGGQVSYSQVWDFEITDLEKVPVEILRSAALSIKGREALESTIRMRVKSGVRAMEGVRIYQTEQPSVRR